MTIHASSVIPLWLNEWDPDFYSSLTSQENVCYVRKGHLDSIEAWRPLFIDLANALYNWRSVEREGLIDSLIMPMYSYNVLGSLHGNDLSANLEVQVHSLFSIGGFHEACKSRPVGYYDDLTEKGLAPPSFRLALDIATINSAADEEVSLIKSIVSTMQASIYSHISRALFEDVPVIGTSPSKTDLANLIFNSTGLKKAYKVLNIGNLTLPFILH